MRTMKSKRIDINPNNLKRIESHVQGRILAGLVQLVPIMVTIFVMAFIIGYADAMIRPLVFIKDKPWDFPGVGLIIMILIFYVIGLVIAVPWGQRAMNGANAALSKLPVARVIFSVTEQATSMMTSNFNFSRVVFLEWPREGMVAIGFVTGRVYSESKDRSLAVVYIPTVPNPTSGNMAFVNEDDLFETDIKAEDAVKLIFSGGIVLPDKLAMARVTRNADEREFIGNFESG